MRVQMSSNSTSLNCATQHNAQITRSNWGLSIVY